MWQTGISDAIIIRSPITNTGIPQDTTRCVFILVNTTQYGAARKQISTLNLNSILNEQDHMVWVVQDFQELLTGDRAVEGLLHMAELSEALKIPCKSSIYILHQNPIYNLAFLMFQFDHSLKYRPHELINELQTNFGYYLAPDISNTLSDMINKIHLR